MLLLFQKPTKLDGHLVAGACSSSTSSGKHEVKVRRCKEKAKLKIIKKRLCIFCLKRMGKRKG